MTACSRRRRAPTVALALALAAAVAIVYWPTLGFEFLSFDDDEFVYQNPMVTGGLTPATVWRAFREPYIGLWIPLTWLSLSLDGALAGPDPGAFHLTNVGLHAANAVLLFLVLRRLAGSRGAAALAAAIFALHPLRVESVAWITERKDVLSTCFLLLSLLAYGAWVRRGGRGRYLASWCAAALGLMAKPMLVSLPLLLLALDFWPLGRLGPRRGEGGAARLRTAARLLLEKVPFALLSAVFSAVTLAAQRDSLVAIGRIPLVLRLETACASYVVYLRRLVWPLDLALNTTGVLQPPRPLRLALAALALVAASLLAARVARRAPWATSGWLWYLASLFPVSGIALTGAHTVSDRFTYVPHIGLGLALSWAVARVAAGGRRAGRAIALGAVAALLALAAASRLQAGHWRDTETLFTRSLAVWPDDPFAHTHLGGILLDRGDVAGGVDHLRRTIAVTPLDPNAQERLGMALARAGDAAGAVVHLREAARLDPGNRTVRFNLGVALARAGRVREAEEEYRAVARQQPDDVEARFNLALLLFEGGRLPEARAELEELRRRDPRSARVHALLARVWEGLGDAARARAHRERASALEAQDPAAAAGGPR